MRFPDVHVHVHVDLDEGPLDAIVANQQEMLALLRSINQKENQQMLDLSALTTEVSENTDVTASAAALLATLAEEVRATAGDPEAVAALAARLDENNAALAAAVVANTPAAPEPEPVPEPEPAPEPEPVEGETPVEEGTTPEEGDTPEV